MQQHTDENSCYAEHDATESVCVLLNGSPGTAGNPTDAEDSPDCRETQGTDTEPQAATFPGAILFFYTASLSFTLHTTLSVTKLQCTSDCRMRTRQGLQYSEHLHQRVNK